ncbi:MAG: hypothetical protein AUJ32_03225 [Parcubacteria group bacterium CG1_02_40_82]|uniref:Uncharacterized protein n=3 Tax=Candidatus Portnoyibacteriota TaxID=1817913 RepID=A0A2M7II52_9BACT|nr:MAG: hypothetical protein AUJ32_03225 [Parcubacteria group bacterium CG1_02_40_82]PIQ75192.1 MAG: hypothetical protein COV84_02485 [Candidatus Portnoybacteria bacterium CG11_big_fil_rev_8_21_14_0_20_40_15]PIS31440.1 MAG: hypothetical protein COT41_01760 [Candidatus Portnoybacteria bacterium CG08_land_8_20_14_0_20_40_83]PIW76138.1 MAG: hypothetical protein CO001_02910 [Candidatus Portnoybacteria bacterium CG_4_8_14_3_um_filter_40_10]PJA64792.1 MAG: hypothetical protein CO159_01235 [Candidatus
MLFVSAGARAKRIHPALVQFKSGAPPTGMVLPRIFVAGRNPVPKAKNTSLSFTTWADGLLVRWVINNYFPEYENEIGLALPKPF